MKIEPLVGALGAEILDIDLSAALPPDTLAAVRRALFDYQVIVFREQRLSLEQHKNFARQFGPLHVHPYIMAKSLDGHPKCCASSRKKRTGACSARSGTPT
jgi:taurine dioxygenase